VVIKHYWLLVIYLLKQELWVREIIWMSFDKMATIIPRSVKPFFPLPVSFFLFFAYFTLKIYNRAMCFSM
jgi:hypothetical protein